MPQRKPNILVFMTDQHRFDTAQPGHPCRTPNLERLMREGINFTHAFTPMTHCCPARASLMTGQYPSKHGVHNNVCNGPAINRDLNPDSETFSEKLRDAGYRLAYAGKWHVSAKRDPKDFGWEELEITATGTYPFEDSDVYLNRPREDSRPRERGELVAPGWGRNKIYGKAEGGIEDRRDYAFVQSALTKLNEFAEGEAPWCLFVSCTGPHGPFVVPEPYASMYDPRDVELPPNYNDEMGSRPQYYQRMQNKYRQFSPDEIKEAIAHYWGYCTMMDDYLGMTLDALDKTGQADDTLVLWLSDHGEFLGSHGLLAKGIAPFDETYRVPFAARWPRGIDRPGREEDRFVTLCDVSPTLTEIAGAQPTRDPSGRSLAPLFRGEAPEDWPDAFYNQCNGVEIYFTQRMVRTKKWKLVYNPAQVDELYDLENDPWETDNLIDREDLQPVVKELFVKLWTFGRKEHDYMSGYHTVSLAPYGPAFALGSDE